MRTLIVLISALSVSVMAQDGFVTVTNGSTVRGAGSGGGASATFNATQFGSDSGGTNILSGALMTNVLFKGLGSSNDVTGNYFNWTNGILTIVESNSATTTALGISMTNNVIATSGAPKSSPRIDIWGNGFGTTGSTNAPIGFSIGMIPTSAGTAGGSLVISNQLGGAAPTKVLDISDTGVITGGTGVGATLTMGGTLKSSLSGVTVAASSLILWTTQGRLTSTGDGTWQFLNSAQSQIGAAQNNVFNLTKTANYTLLATDSGKYINNIGAGGAVTNTLPTAVAGQHFYFYLDAAQTLCVQAVGSDTIRFRATVSAAAGNIFSATQGAYLHVFAPAALKWVVDNISGTAVGTTTDWTGPQ